MPYASVNGIQLYYEEHGKGDVIVFAHGRGGNHLSWWQQVPDFAQDHRCIVFDHRSFGRSRDAPQAVGQDAFVQDLAALLDHLGIEQAHLVAQSMGGRTCLGFALAHAHRTRRLVLADTTAGIVDEELNRLTGERGPPPEDLLTRVLSAGFRRREPMLTFLYQSIEALNHTDNKPTRLVEGGPSRVVLKQCNVPVLLVAGDQDPLVPQSAMTLMASMLPYAVTRTIDDAGHSAYFERPAVFNRLVRSFLTGTSQEQ